MKSDENPHPHRDRFLTGLLGAYAVIVGVFHAVAALDEVNRRDKMPAVRAAAVTDGIRALRTLDTWHLAEVAASRQQFYATTRIGERESVHAHRRELADLVDEHLDRELLQRLLSPTS